MATYCKVCGACMGIDARTTTCARCEVHKQMVDQMPTIEATEQNKAQLIQRVISFILSSNTESFRFSWTRNVINETQPTDQWERYRPGRESRLILIKVDKDDH